MGSGGSVSPGARTPHGEDLSDPALVRTRLRALLDAPRRDWAAIADLVGIHPGGLPGDLRLALLEALLDPAQSAGAIRAFERMSDDALALDLLRELREPRITPEVRRFVLAALAGMPGGDDAEVARGIEPLLTGDPEKDAPALRVLAARGGSESARVLVGAVVRDPARFPVAALRDWDLSKDAEAAGVVAAALADPATPPQALRALVEVAGRPSSPAVVSALVALDAEGRPEEVRRQALQSLARTGDPRAVEHLLAAAAEPGDRGRSAAAALAQATTAQAAARERLHAAAREASDPTLRRSLVEALGNLRVEAAIPTLEGFLADADDRVRVASVLSLGKMGAAANASVPALVRAFEAGGDGTKSAVANALAGIRTPEAKAALEEMAKVETNTSQVRQVIAAALRTAKW
jgi:HEAT repeat protein